MERMLIHTELTVIAGDHESYRISTKMKKQETSKLWHRINTINTAKN